MKAISLAFLYNIQRIYPSLNDPQSFLEADYDDVKTIEWIVKHLKNVVKEVIPIEANKEAYLKLYEERGKIDLAFNFSLGLYGQSRYAQLPAILEMLQIPYTGSSVLTQALLMDKGKAKEVLLANNISTPPFQLFISGEEKLNENLKFPLIVKPTARGSSAGITNQSVVRDEGSLKKQVSFVINLFNEPALVEPFLIGREFSIAMLGNPPRILPIIEPNHSQLPKSYERLDSLEVKWLFEDTEEAKDYLGCPAKVSPELRQKLEDLCLGTWRSLQILDWCRIDLRCDQEGNPYVLDINSPAGIMPPEVSKTSYFPVASRAAGMDYEEMLETIIETTLQRYGKKESQ